MTYDLVWNHDLHQIEVKQGDKTVAAVHADVTWIELDEPDSPAEEEDTAA